ncbi:hypothetical protein WJ0W_000186 [Paenibacillus melissococcoides]|uniref:Uncharacterized protein n=1 Tax=Paenibacillus melissococcoides TaxID=2912268 RepID=A0ABM9FV02_9BACL|nr:MULTISPECIES: hypothetical protein [Paenibacillus]CAH8242977.1 hypothetical protein WJ0W_000186 [Paenibacillus melissococcoides]CAH8703510.1 hypothetical protein WDD9_000183 [Paenibacillus melissococcoides]CAH8706427.1 hypothetical protein HTL2_001267 [Paenibacillus melissococcoides]
MTNVEVGETAAGRAAEEGEAANPAYVQEFTRFHQRSDAIPAKMHHFRRFFLSIHWYS